MALKMLKFDAETAAFLDRVYKGRDATRRRMANIDALNPGAGETILDLGCGNGMALPELHTAMNGQGRIIGLDPSGDMLESAAAATKGLETVELLEGDAYALPFPDASIDGIMSVQVFEYIPDVPRALGECARVLKPGGRLVIGDMDFATLSWASENPVRMARILDIWNNHFADGHVPPKLPGWMLDAGFESVSATPLQFFDRTLRSDGLAAMMHRLLATYARQTMDEGALADAWYDEQEMLAATGRFYFAFSHIVTRARKV